MNQAVKIAPSLLSADFSRLADEIKDVSDGGADWLHLDVMDGLFVPNITFGMPVIKDIRKVTDIFFDCHLMIAEPTRFLKDFADAGADLITIHHEATRDMNAALEILNGLNVKKGISINPETPVQEILPYVGKVDLILLMSVHPGFGGQSFIDITHKIKYLKDFISDNKLDTLIEVDGGIDENTAPLVRNAGADVLVAGSAVFKQTNRKQAIEGIRQAAGGHS